MSRQPLNHRQRIDRVHAVRVPASPFVQFFYPLNLPLALYYRVAGGYSVVDHQTFTVLGIAVFSLGLFLWLESLVPSRRSVLFATLLVGLRWARDAAEVEGEEIRIVRNYDEVFAASFSEPRVQKRTSLTYPSLNVGVVPNWYFERYTTFLKAYRRDPNFGRFMGMEDGQRIYVTRALDHGASLKRFLADADLARGNAEATVHAYDGDVLDLAVSAQNPVYVSFIDNWNEDWRVLVDGREAKMELPFGTFKGVRVEAGEHRVRFEYVPFF